MFERVEPSERLSDKVARQLLDSILGARLQPGDRLPSERDLGEQFGVSRTVVREAVRDLVAKGVLEVRSGSGARVARVDARAVSEPMRLFLRSQGLGYRQINEVRMTLETQTAALAAARATSKDVAELRAACDRLDELDSGDHEPTVEDVAVADVEFHRLVARATHNPLYGALLDSIGDVLLDIRRATVGLPGRRALGRRHHWEIFERIAARDAEGAQAAMRAHLEEAAEAWRQLEAAQT
jgi:GntR family transcriptional regulator, transcriptional repressor for pyruvate dehydrogenase complex